MYDIIGAEVISMSQTAQMNFRIDPRLKKTGDMALGESSVSPSALIRCVWEYLSRNRHTPDAVARLMQFLRTDGETTDDSASGKPAAQSAESLVMAGPNLIATFYESIGISPSDVTPRPYEDMKLDAYADKYPSLRA
jgi:hypothetical protein